MPDCSPSIPLSAVVNRTSLHPLMPLVEPYSDASMARAVAAALGLSFCVYATLAFGAALAFGPHTQVCRALTYARL